MKKELLKTLYYNLKLPRFIEERMLLLLRQGKISKWFSGIGQEAISVGVTSALDDNDVIFPMHRNLGVFTTRNLNLIRLFSQLFGKDGGYTKGRDRTFHFGSMKHNIIGMISHLAAMLPVANGLALSFKIKGNKRIALAFIGDGATSEGDFHESLNLAAVWDLPIIFLIENNGYGLSTPTSEQYKCKNLVDKANGYGIEGVKIDGNNILEVYETVKKYSDKIRKNPKPILIEAETFRMRGHEEASGVKYVPKKVIEKWEKKDPILLFEKHLKSKKILTKKDFDEINSSIESSVLPAIDEALKHNLPESNVSEEMSDVFYKSKFKTIKPINDKIDKVRFVDAIKNTLYDKMLLDESIILMGQDIAEYGGVFKVTEGFVEKFGKDRVRNTPIIESGVVGAAMGMAINGFKPIVELQFADFVSVGFNQIVNNLAKTHYRWNQSINVTLRMPTGGSIGAGPFHSQSNESWFFHVPGIKIVYPSNPYDAKGLLCSSIDDGNPVMFFEHKALYRSVEENIPNSMYNIELGKLSVIKEGKDLTLITYGLGVNWAKKVANKSKYDIEILDLRTLVPLDVEGIFKSISKTNRVLILHEDNLTGGIGAEISAIINENYFEYLDAPIFRSCSIDTPIPFASNIEDKVYLPTSTLEEKINTLMEY